MGLTYSKTGGQKRISPEQDKKMDMLEDENISNHEFVQSRILPVMKTDKSDIVSVSDNTKPAPQPNKIII